MQQKGENSRHIANVVSSDQPPTRSKLSRWVAPLSHQSGAELFASPPQPASRRGGLPGWTGQRRHGCEVEGWDRSKSAIVSDLSCAKRGKKSDLGPKGSSEVVWMRTGMRLTSHSQCCINQPSTRSPHSLRAMLSSINGPTQPQHCCGLQWKLGSTAVAARSNSGVAARESWRFAECCLCVCSIQGRSASVRVVSATPYIMKSKMREWSVVEVGG